MIISDTSRRTAPEIGKPLLAGCRFWHCCCQHIVDRLSGHAELTSESSLVAPGFYTLLHITGVTATHPTSSRVPLQPPEQPWCVRRWPLPVQTMPDTWIVTECPLCGQRRRYLPTDIFRGHLSHKLEVNPEPSRVRKWAR